MRPKVGLTFEFEMFLRKILHSLVASLQKGFWKVNLLQVTQRTMRKCFCLISHWLHKVFLLKLLEYAETPEENPTFTDLSPNWLWNSYPVKFLWLCHGFPYCQESLLLCLTLMQIFFAASKQLQTIGLWHLLLLFCCGIWD